MEPQNRPPEDPFFAEVRRRHPDVDLVLLPPERPPGEPAADAEPAAAEALVLVATQARQLWAAVAPDAAEEPEARHRFGGDPGAVRPVASLATRREDGAEVLARLRRELEGHGWEVRGDAGPERLTAALDPLHVAASYARATGALVLTISGPSVPVGAERARALTAAGRRR